MNNWNITGNLGRDAEQRFTQGGESIVSFSVAVKSGYGDKEKTVWPRCTIFGKRGESLLPYLKKGSQVAITGELSLNEYQDKEGQQKTTLELRVSDLTLIGGKGANASAQSQPNSGIRSDNRQKPSAADLGDDIPW